MPRIATAALTLPMLCAAVAVPAGTLPDDWRDWTAVQTKLAKIGALPGCDADVSSLPGIYQRTVGLYCGVRPEGPGKVRVLVSDAALPAYHFRNGSFPDGAQAALHLSDLGILMVTTYEDGTPVFQVFKEDGEEITADEGPLSAGVCAECHTDPSCVNGGQCGTIE
jgi:hypothetical protein